MDVQYKVIISGRNFYREVVLPAEEKQVTAGTELNCDVRLPKTTFFEPFELQFRNDGKQWIVNCSPNIYVTTGTMSKLLQRQIAHGDELEVGYYASDTIFLEMSVTIDFDAITHPFNRVADLSGKSKISIGGQQGCDIYITNRMVARDLVMLSAKGDRYILTEKNSRYGVYVNGVRIRKDTVLHEYDFFSIGEYKFFLKGQSLYIAAAGEISVNGLPCEDCSEQKGCLAYPKFNRNSRLKTKLCRDEIQVLNPPEKPQKPQDNILATIFPTIAMLILTIVVRGMMGSGGSYVIFSVCTMGIGVITSIASYFSGRHRYKKETAERIEKYNAYIERKRQEIHRAREEERAELEELYFSPEREYNIVHDFSGELFDRMPKDEDFLYVRLGLGERESLRQTAFKQQEVIEVSDELTLLPEQVHEEYKILADAPITLGLAEYDAIGVVGSDKRCYDLMKNMTYDLCVRHYPTDLQFYYITDESCAERISWVRWLPHVENPDLGIRNIVCDSASRNLLFEYLFIQLSQNREQAQQNPEKTHHIIFVMQDMGIKNHPLSQYIEGAHQAGFTFIFFEEYIEQLPQHCGAVIRLDPEEKTASLVRTDDKEAVSRFRYQTISDRVALETALKLTPVYCDEINLEGSLTRSISFFQMLRIFVPEDIDLGQNWDNAQIHKTMAAPLGVNAKQEIVYLDLHEKAHGPHGLVAGTTGSGKSEILQSYILSMAIHFHPYEVGFVIIDFKGGGMANQFRSLPHLIGTITNIDGKEINRSLKSIKAELQKRQRLFAENGVNKIDSYIQRYKQGKTSIPLPHLIIIVDEFAELKADQPEFMKELISAARIGRSLGVHLILATQKPAGQVNEQIWSNSKFRLCLKVQNQEDSKEVIKSPLAAEIREPGRAYLQVGNNEIFELFQSAYSGGAAKVDEDSNVHEFVIREANLWGNRKVVYQQTKRKVADTGKSKSQLDVIVDYVHDYCRKQQIRSLPSICLPALEKVILFRSTERKKDTIAVDIGWYDDPDTQYQGPVKLDVMTQNVLIVGSSQYGKTNLLQTIIRGLQETYTPQQVNLYILDFGSMILKNYESSNFVGGVVCASEDEKLKNLFRMLQSEIQTRKERLAQVGVSSYASYCEAGYTDLPQIVVMVDNFTALRELYMENDDFLLPICRDGLAFGISTVITNSQTAGLGYKYMSNFAQKIALYCNDSSEYAVLLDRCRIVPENTPGRGILAIEKNPYEFQSYLCFEGEKEIDRINSIRKHIEKIQAKYGTMCAKRIPEVPQVLDYSYTDREIRDDQWKPYQVPIGINYETVSWMTLDLSRALTVAISGREQFGKTNLVGLMMDYLQRNVFDYPSKAYIIDDYEHQLERYSSYGFVEKYTTDTSELDLILTDMEEELKIRTEMLHAGGSLETEPLLLCVLQSRELMLANGIQRDTMEKLKRILKAYAHMKVCFVFANVENGPIPYNAPDSMKLVKECGHVFFCDDLANLKLFDISIATQKKFKKPLELGDAYYITEKEVIKEKIIHAERPV